MLNTISKKMTIITILFILFLSTTFFLTPEISQAELALLEEYPGIEKVADAITQGNSSQALAEYINFIVKYSTGFLSIAAVIMLIYAGIIYITSETFIKKSDAKEIIGRSIGAIVLLLSSFIFFNQLNPELLKVRFKPIEQKQGPVKIDSIDDI